MEDIIISVVQRTLVAGTPLLLGTVGEIICERSGILNLGVEGVMAVGAVTAFIVTHHTGNPWLGLCAAIIAGMLISIVHAFASVSLQSNQVVSGAFMLLAVKGEWQVEYFTQVPRGQKSELKPLSTRHKVFL